MHSLIKRDIMKNVNYKYIFCVFIIYVFYLIFQIIFLPSLFTDILKLFSRNIGICFNFVHFLDILIILITNFLFSYISISLLISDLSYGKEQILLRINRKKYAIIKIISIFLITFVINIFLYLIMSIILYIFKYDIYNIEFINLFIKDFIMKLIFEYIVIIIYLFNNKFSNLCLFITPIISLLKINSLDILFAYNHRNIYDLLLILVVVIVIIYYVLYFKIDNLFERNEKNEI